MLNAAKSSILRIGAWHFRGIAHVIANWRSRMAARRDLLKLTAGELRDIGMSQSEAMIEANKPFWRE
jgi:uncharacterized protein YjiS (DUF1127 family)